MRDSLRTTVGQFSSTEGRVMTRAANVRAVEPAADLPGAGRGNLYMLVEVSGGGHAALYRQILNAAQTAFYETEGSMITALSRAVRSADLVLRRANEGLPEAGWRAGITCVALQGDELTIAQVRPALMLVSHPKTVELFPRDVSATSMPLGEGDRPEVVFDRTQVEPGSLLLLAESCWQDHQSPDVLAAVATAETPAQALEWLGQLSGTAELSALVVGVSSGGPAGGPAGVPKVSDGVYTSTETPGGAAESAPAAGAPAPRRGLFGLFGGRQTPEPEPPEQDTLPRAEHATAASPVRTAPGQATPAQVAPPARRVVTPPPQLVEEPDEYSYETSSAEAEAEAPAAVYERPTKRSPWPLVLALVIVPLLIAAVVLSMWWLRTRSQDAQFQTKLDGATAAITAAQGLTDESAQRDRLNAAKELLDSARALKPNDVRLEPVQAKLDQNLDRVDHVTPLYGTVPLWDFTGDGHQLSSVTVKANNIYVLDKGKQQISRLILSDLGDTAKPADPGVVLAKGATVGDQPAADLVDMTWVDAVSNQRSRLLALDSAGGLLSYDVTWGAARLSIGGRDQWGTPALTASYAGNLYVVDSKANQIWRYKPTDKGYESAPEKYFSANTHVDLAGVTSIAIDGNIWLLYSDGRLLKFFGGDQSPFELKGLPGKLSGPVAVAVSAEGDQLYIADTGNGRIVEVNKSGQFQRQLRPAQGTMLREMRGLYLDEPGGYFYVLTNNRLYKTSLPRSGGATTPAAATPAATGTPAN